MELFKSSPTFERLTSRQFNSNQIAVNLRKSGYIFNLPQDYISRGNLTKDDMIDRLNKFENCGSIVEIEKYSDNSHIIRNANYCGLLGCWHCGAKTEKKRYIKLKPKIEEAIKNYRYAYHVVFTIADGSDVRERSDFLRQSLKKFRLFGQRRGKKHSGGEYAKVKAGIFSHEIVEGKYSKEYHTHCHSILWTDEQLDFRVYDSDKKAELQTQYGNNIPKNILDTIATRHIDKYGEQKAASKISEEWYKATEGNATSIFIRLIDSEKAYKDAITEVIKYATKMNENAPQRVAEILADCHGLRFFSTARKMRYSLKDGETPPEPPPEKQLESEILCFKWDEKSKQYADYETQKAIIYHDTDEDKRQCLSKAAKVIGEYRKARNAVIDSPLSESPLYSQLDALKAHYRKIIRQIWKAYARNQWQAHQPEAGTEPQPEGDPARIGAEYPDPDHPPEFQEMQLEFSF